MATLFHEKVRSPKSASVCSVCCTNWSAGPVRINGARRDATVGGRRKVALVGWQRSCPANDGAHSHTIVAFGCVCVGTTTPQWDGLPCMVTRFKAQLVMRCRIPSICEMLFSVMDIDSSVVVKGANNAASIDVN